MTSPDLIPTAIVSVVGGLFGGLISAIAKPLGENFVGRRADERTRKRDQVDNRRQRIERVLQILGGARVSGPATATEQREYQELRGAAYAVGDAVLTGAVEVMLKSEDRGATWRDAHETASRRVGELLNVLD